jgi:hypothetical protein
VQSECLSLVIIHVKRQGDFHRYLRVPGGQGIQAGEKEA